MDITKLATELIANKLNGQIDKAIIEQAITSLLGSGSGGIDINALVTNFMQNGGLENIIGSWLGDGANDAISPDQITAALGEDKIATFANRLNVDSNQAKTDLADIIPQLIDQSSSGGSLIDSVGGIEGLAGLANKLF